MAKFVLKQNVKDHGPLVSLWVNEWSIVSESWHIPDAVLGCEFIENLLYFAPPVSVNC